MIDANRSTNVTSDWGFAVTVPADATPAVAAAEAWFVAALADEDAPDVERGFLVAMDPCLVGGDDGSVVWDNDSYSVLDTERRRRSIPACGGRVDSPPGRDCSRCAGIYQLRGLDISNITDRRGRQAGRTRGLRERGRRYGDGTPRTCSGNQGRNGIAIAEEIRLPPVPEKTWHARGCHGSVSHNVKAVYHMGWFDGNPAHLWGYPPVESAKWHVEFMVGSAEVPRKARKSFANRDFRWIALRAGSRLRDRDAVRRRACRAVVAER